MLAPKAIVGALVAGGSTFALALADHHPWPVAAGLAVTAAIVSFSGVYRAPYKTKA